MGLNPSRKEFPAEAGKRLLRFPTASCLVEGWQERDDQARIHLDSLNSYFKNDPYRFWFNRSYARLLKGMSASYYGDAPNTPLHTDFCSPIATDPTWKELHPKTRQALMDTGVPLWHRLIEELQPDIALISIQSWCLDLIAFEAETPWKTAYTVERDNPYDVRTSWRRIGASGKRCLFVFGRAANVPFGTVRGEDCERTGRHVLGEVSRG